jgi:hypothetical protein
MRGGALPDNFIEYTLSAILTYLLTSANKRDNLLAYRAASLRFSVDKLLGGDEAAKLVNGFRDVLQEYTPSADEINRYILSPIAPPDIDEKNSNVQLLRDRLAQARNLDRDIILMERDQAERRVLSSTEAVAKAQRALDAAPEGLAGDKRQELEQKLANARTSQAKALAERDLRGRLARNVAPPPQPRPAQPQPAPQPQPRTTSAAPPPKTREQRQREAQEREQQRFEQQRREQEEQARQAAETARGQSEARRQAEAEAQARRQAEEQVNILEFRFRRAIEDTDIDSAKILLNQIIRVVNDNNLGGFYPARMATLKSQYSAAKAVADARRQAAEAEAARQAAADAEARDATPKMMLDRTIDVINRSLARNDITNALRTMNELDDFERQLQEQRPDFTAKYGYYGPRIQALRTRVRQAQAAEARAREEPVPMEVVEEEERTQRPRTWSQRRIRLKTGRQGGKKSRKQKH